VATNRATVAYTKSYNGDSSYLISTYVTVLLSIVQLSSLTIVFPIYTPTLFPYSKVGAARTPAAAKLRSNDDNDRMYIIYLQQCYENVRMYVHAMRTKK